MGKKKLFGWIEAIVTLLVTFAIGGLFASGTTLTLPLLSYIPAIVHTIVGWGIIIWAVVGIVRKFI